MRRVFLGVRPTPDCLKRLCRFQDELKASENGRASLRPRWVPEAALHLTLHFLGQVPPSRVDLLRRELFRLWPQLSEGGEFEQPLSEWVFFPKASEANVGTLGNPQACERLSHWHQILRESLEKLGFRIEKKAFLPHITLVRWGSGCRIVPPAFPVPWFFPVQNLVLYESVGEGGSPTYLPIQEFRLARPLNPMVRNSH